MSLDRLLVDGALSRVPDSPELAVPCSMKHADALLGRIQAALIDRGWLDSERSA
jgi:hypothetical protein